MVRFCAAARVCIAVLLAAASVASSAHAEDYPARPVRIIVPNEPGGVYDFVGRLLASELSSRFPQRFYVENKPGGGSIVGTQTAAQAAPDGYTLLMGGPSSMVFNAALYQKLSAIRLLDEAHRQHRDDARLMPTAIESPASSHALQ